MERRDKKGSKGCFPEFGGLERNVLGKGKYMNEFSWVISGECCNRVRKASLSASSTRGSWGGSLLIPSFCPFAFWALGPGPTLDWISASSRSQTGHEQVCRPHPSLKEAAVNLQPLQLVASECQGWAPSQMSS